MASLERDYSGVMAHREKLLAQKARSSAIRLPGATHDLYRELAAASKANLTPQSDRDPIPRRDETEPRIRALLRQLADAGEVVQ